MNNVEITFIGKPDCSLCDTAWQVLQTVLAELSVELPAEQRQRLTTQVLSILNDPALNERYWEEIPVLLINGQVHDYWRFTSARLKPALLKALGHS